ncbi:imidazole glycerol phosphate synthase subunit HisF [Neptunomonas qingdaonensis]|uniref:imidazole glycerol-phosphate synthase n=1 Tax=Neptunomonas qingdaonensis TaxID=1045558 RepID=A0A1I2MZ36_9GAMM|nr:imidazole glycerol phosphate synthase cyclase subunit [Neptunomonas qingdaonensis]SFF96140.1 cyclase [Neptunomonas qingdaonensis]
MSLRIIAKLDVKPPYVVKPVHFEGLRKIGLPAELAEKYYKQGADELIYTDIVASLYQREILFAEVEKAAKEVFIPFSVGGGVRSIDDFSKLFHSGADKVVINTYAVQNDPHIIKQASEIFGSQSVIVNIEAKKWGSSWECYTDCGRVRSGKSVLDWVNEVADLGAGEIMLQSVDCDGRQRGYDIDLVSSVVESVSIPVIAASGAGNLEDVLSVVQQARPDAVALASILHYEKTTIREVKDFLRKNGVEVS